MPSINMGPLSRTSLVRRLVSSVTMRISLFLLLLTSRTEAKQNLYIGGFFPLDNNNWDAAGLIPAAEMAIEDVNNRTDLLADYELQMEWNNTKCDAGVGMASLIHQITASTRKVMLLGAGCTLVTGPMAETAQYWNLVQVSHSSSSPSLNNRGKYPLLFRLYPSEESMNFPRVALMKQFGWKQAALLHSSEGGFSMVIQHMRDLLVKSGMVPVLSESFAVDPTSALENIKVKEARIIIANMFESTARVVFCKARNLGMTGPGHVWIIPGWFSDEWYLEDDTPCSPTEMTEAVSGYISMETQQTDASAKVTESGRTPAQFLTDYNALVTRTSYAAHDLAPFSYDSVYTIALALNASIEPLLQIRARLEDFDYNKREIAQVFFTAVNNTNFSGITGPIRFDINGNRLGYTKIEQMQDGVEVPIAIFDDSLLSFVELNESAFIWSTEDGEPPLDGPQRVKEWRTVSLPLVIAMTVLAVAGVLFVIFLLVINIIYRDRRIMKLSSPNMNYLICVGCFFMYDYVIFLGLDSTLLKLDEKPSEFFSATCMVKQWLLPISFSLTFGATFAKAWRIHRIFSNSKMKKRTIRDSQLMIIVVVLLVIDAILLVTWDVIDRPIGSNISLPQESKGRDVIILPHIEHCFCRKENIWIGVFFGYKGLLLLYGAFLAWENRVVKIDALSDARNIGITIYSTVVLCCVVAPVAVVFNEELDFAYASLAGSINFATTVMLALCFIPKVHIIFTNSVSTENIIVANMMTMTQRQGEMNTEDRLISDLKQKIKELETENVRLKQSGKISSPMPASERRLRNNNACSLVKYSNTKGTQLVIESAADESTVSSRAEENGHGSSSQSDKPNSTT